MKLRKKHLLFLLTLFCTTINAQNFEWLKSYGSKKNHDIISGICTEIQDGCTFMINSGFYNSNSTLADTLFIDTFRFPIAGNKKGIGSYIIRLDSIGKIKKLKKLGNFELIDICKLKTDYLVYGAISDSSKIVGNSTLDIDSGRVIFAKLDSNFNIIWVKQFGNNNNLLYGSKSGRSFRSFTKFNDRVYFTFPVIGTNLIDSNIYYFGGNLTSVYGELNVLNGDLKWLNFFYNGNLQNVSIEINGIVRLKNKIYLSGTMSKIYGAIIAGDTFNKGGFVAMCDSVGNYLRKFSCLSVDRNNNYATIKSIETDGESIFVCGSFNDTLIWENQKISPSYSTGTFKIEMFAASINSELVPKWFFHPQIVSQSSFGTGYLQRIIFDGNYLYYSGLLSSDIVLNGQTLKASLNNIFFLKTDILGNTLWGVTAKSYATTYGIIASNKKSVYVGGAFLDTLQLGSTSVNSGNRFVYDAFLTKLSDNAIIRGAVSSGPYCAGDSIKVPYKKIGDYDTSNYFIAELSDEQGNFTGKHRELGRLKSNQNGTVTGLLPLFKVASSKLYRIRIISTAPVVQSYYKVDTLRLLIYSKDKAWAGNDTTICKGDSLQLETFGGTKWHWSPGYKIQDSTARTPFAWPDKTTTYRITISDSSGCGVPDTAYKTIKVRPEPKITVLTPRDTSICLGGTLPIVANYSGGDSLGYQSLWFSINSNGLWTLERQQSLKQQDTLNFAMPLSEPDSMRFILYLTDGCTPKTAFATYTLKIKKQSAQANFEFKDTSLCPGSTNALLANFTGSPKEKLSWSWQENTSIANQWVQRRTASNKQSDTWSYTLPLNWKNTKKIRVLLNDACSGLKDTALLNIIPKDTLQLQLNTQDTTLCKGQLYTFKAVGKGGNKDGYKYVWTDIASGDTLSTSDSLKLQADTSLTIRLVLNDGCMPKTISRQFTITVRAPLKITINNPNDTVLCDGQSLTYRASAVGGNGQFNYQWLNNGVLISNKDSAAIQHITNQATIRILQVVLSDGCTLNNDTASINLHYKAPLSQSLNVIDSLCFGAKATLKTKASGGVDNYVYQWQSNATNLSNTDSLPIINIKAGKETYISIVKDGCSSPDTISIDIVNLDPLKIQLSTSDSCPTGSALIVSQVTGGLRSQLTINWYNKSAPIYQGSTLSINPSNYSDKVFTAIASDGCSIQNDTASLRIGASPKVKISAIGECLGDTTQFTAKQLNPSNAINYQWRLNGQALAQNDSIVKHFFSQFGPYKIRVDISSNNSQCKGSDSLTGFILVKPRAAFTLAHFERTASGIPFKFINQSSNDNTWLWQFGNGDTSQRKHPNYSYADTGKFKVTLIVSNQNKCFDSTSLLLPVMDKIEFFYPNAFSPNSNGINESFGLSANQWNKVKEYNLKIYNRWGEKVFDSDHMEEHWSGDKAQQAVYIYKANIRDVYNVLHEIEGVVEVMK